MSTSRRIKEIFVYGTLMQGGLYSEILQRGGVRYLGPARCRGRLHDLGDYPGLVLQGKAWVSGEIYRADDIDALLQVLDDLEVAYGFERTVVEADWQHGPGEAWCWIYRGDLKSAPVLQGGSWRAHQRREKRRG